QYSNAATVEYLFTKSSMHALRASYGKRFGFYLCWKWGEYKKAGADIDNVKFNYNVTKASELGYIRNAYTAGFRFGAMNKNIVDLYLLLGGGYGEYGRQWKNPLEIESNIYFHSDYIKGFEGDLACQCVLFDWICISVGAGLLTGQGKISIDYQFGVGLNMNFDKIFKRKINRKP
ncbi:MAG: hypothetical protein NC548_57260, partial [Lachnospiraceae bacterium]|nr:hypothetical protein [Lachnospiraceae bacterium]